MVLCLGVVLGATKTRLFGKKSGVPLIHKSIEWGEPLTLIKFSLRAAASRSRASGGRRENLIRVRGSPHFFDLWVRGTSTFFTENVEFSAKTVR